MNNISDNYENNISNYVLNNKIIRDERFIFGNLFGIVSEKYIKYFNFACLQIIFVTIFALIYFVLLLNFNDHFFVPGDFPKEFIKDYISKHKLFIAFYMSINFQTTMAYIDIKCKSYFCRVVIMFQLVQTVMLAFLFLTV
jgi:hypothetical protein